MTWTLPSAILFLLMLLLLLGYVLARKVFPPAGDKPRDPGTPQGLDCESCGEAGCGGFAKALVRGGQDRVPACPGAERPPGAKARAVVRCRGRRVEPRYLYDGAKTCKAAAGMQPRPKACPDACLGYGDCVGVCSSRAIRVRKGLAWIDPSLCTGCGDCVPACPVGIIEMIPPFPGLSTSCSCAQGTGEDRPCLDGCTGCGDCVRACPEGALGQLPDGFPLLDPDLCTRCGDCVEACPYEILSLFPGGPAGAGVRGRELRCGVPPRPRGTES